MLDVNGLIPLEFNYKKEWTKYGLSIFVHNKIPWRYHGS